jgi:multicomponent Na+:H+ antiporter subunit E
MRIFADYWSRRFLGAAARRGLLLGVLWWALTGGDFRGWYLAFLFIAGGTALSMALAPPQGPGLRLLGMARFAVFFGKLSLLGGIDVSRRALSPAMPIAPGFIDYPLRLPPDSLAAVLMVNAASLLPGTVGARLEGNAFTLHALDVGLPVMENLRELEERVAGVFGLDLVGPGGDRVSSVRQQPGIDQSGGGSLQ